MRHWLDLLHEKFPDWNCGNLEDIALGALGNFYAFVDQAGEVVPWDLDQFLSVSDSSTEGTSLRHIMRILAALRSAVKALLDEHDHETLDLVYQALDAWQELVLGKYEETLQHRSHTYKVEIVQRMADLNALNHCAATLNALLDLTNSLHATARLSRDLTNADLTAVYFRENGEFFLKACTRSERAAYLPPLRESAGSGVRVGNSMLLYDDGKTITVDRRRQDRPIDVPRTAMGIPQIQAVICVPLHAGDIAIGKLTAAYLDPQEFPDHQIRMLEIFANHAGQAIYNAMLFEQLGDMAVAQERQRIACEMHDTMLQTLVTLNINLRVAIRQARQHNWEEALVVFEQARQLGKVAVQEGRDTLNNLRGECQCTRENENLRAIIQAAAASFSEQSGVVPELCVDDGINVSQNEAHQLNRLIGEALTNVYRHADATYVAIRASLVDGVLRLRVTDNGMGFDPIRANRRGSFGLSGMRERARSINAHLTVDSAPGQGTVVEVNWPRASMAPRNQAFTDSETGFLRSADDTDNGRLNTNQSRSAWSSDIP